jgi:hypothetical protein
VSRRPGRKLLEFISRSSMQRNKILRMSIASGCVWAIIGLAVGFLFVPPRGLGREMLVWAGGIIAGPFIGLLMGQVSRIFGHFEEVLLRIILAGVSLYLAMVFFIMSSLLTSSILYGHPPANVWTNSFGAATWAFELTCVILWPLAYLNHTLISRLWARSR